MNSKYYGQIDLTKLGRIVKQHPELVKKVDFKDGEHKLFNISILESDQPDNYGNIGTVRVDCKRDEQKQGLSYFVGNLKESTPRPQNNFDTPVEPLGQTMEDDDLPF